MAEGFFKSFPIIEYNHIRSRHIMLRSDLSSKALEKYGVFYSYYVHDHERPDTIAHDYYGDSRFMWLVLLSNDILDPYFDWPLSEADLHAFIAKKYGSLEAAMKLQIGVKNVNNPTYVLSKETVDKLTAATDDTVVGFVSPVYAYDLEVEKNESKKNIRLLSRAFAKHAENDLMGSFDDDRK